MATTLQTVNLVERPTVPQEPKELFEFHVTIHPDDDYLLYAYVQQLQQTTAGRTTNEVIKPRATYPRELYGKHPRQPMLTGSLYGTIDKVTATALKLAAEMEQYGIRVVRRKVEALASTAYVAHKTYFESHFKVTTTNCDQYNKIALLVLPDGGHVSFNMHDRVPNPIVTFRVYDSAEHLIELTNRYIEEIKKLGFNIAQNPHFECAIYDDNVLLDSDWIFAGDDTTNVITTPDKITLFPPVPATAV